MVEFIRNSETLTVGKADCNLARPTKSMTPAERRLYEQIADQLLAEHAETLKKLGDE